MKTDGNRIRIEICPDIPFQENTKLVNKQYLAITLLEAPLLALIVSLLTRYVDGDEYTLLANKNFVSYIFMSVIVVPLWG